jgi:outer membrane lipoprotein-sorting protein
MKITHLLTALCLSASVAVPTASASPVSGAPAALMADANKILAEVDRRAKAFGDQQYKATMTIMKDGKTVKVLAFDMIMKELTKQFLVFTAPGDVAGMKVLMQDAETLYVYMPEFKKVRRVAAHVQNQGFLGSEFTYEDMTQTELSPLFDAELVGTKGNETTLSLTPKEGKKSTFSRIDIVIDKTKGGVTKLTYFDGSNNAVRQQTREGWTKIAGQLMPTKITMTNLKDGDATVVELSEVKVNQGVDDDVFSRRMLLRG